MINVYGFGATFGLPDPSPFVLKVITYLKFTNQPYQYFGGVQYLRESPRGKLPFIKDGDQVVSDSRLILEYLQSQYPSKLDQGLSEEQKASASLYAKALDECYYFCLIYSRWVMDDGWQQVCPAFFGGLPPVVRTIVPTVARRTVKKTLQLQGMGRLTHQELLDMAEQVLSSLSTLLGEKPYFFGRDPSSFDAVAYAYLAEVILVTLEGEFCDQAQRYANLVAYCERINNQFFAEQQTDAQD